jgi:hypothetical protein
MVVQMNNYVTLTALLLLLIAFWAWVILTIQGML